MQQCVIPIKVCLVKTTLLANMSINLAGLLNAIGPLDDPAIDALQGKLTRLAARTTDIFGKRLTISRQSHPYFRSRHLNHPSHRLSLSHVYSPTYPFLH